MEDMSLVKAKRMKLEQEREVCWQPMMDNLEEHTPLNLENHTSPLLGEHNLPSLKEHASPGFIHTSVSLGKRISPSIEKHTSPTLQEQTSSSFEKSMRHHGGNKSEKKPFKIKRDLNTDRQTIQKAKIMLRLMKTNVESVICTLCKFMFPGGTRIEEFSEVFFTHLKDDHGMLHNHLHLLESSLVPVTERPTVRQRHQIQLSMEGKERKKRIRGC